MEIAISHHLILKHQDPVQYTWVIDDQYFVLNQLIGKTLLIEASKQIHCVHCKQKISKAYQQGYCYPCTTKLARCDLCIVKPELCHYAKGTCREPRWGEEHCLQDHIIYLAETSDLKVGITRLKNVPRRWLDQGASAALAIIKVKKRIDSGIVEQALCTLFKDKTHWRAMLKAGPPKEDLLMARARAYAHLQELDLAKTVDYQCLGEEKVLTINYPRLNPVSNFASYNLSKCLHIESKLIGMRGQYLIFDQGLININKFKGHQIKLSILD